MHFARGHVNRVSSCLSIVRRFVYVRTEFVFVSLLIQRCIFSGLRTPVLGDAGEVLSLTAGQ